MREDRGDGSDFKAADRLFHTRVAAATRNGALVAVVDQLWESSYAPIFDPSAGVSVAGEPPRGAGRARAHPGQRWSGATARRRGRRCASTSRTSRACHERRRLTARGKIGQATTPSFDRLSTR